MSLLAAKPLASEDTSIPQGLIYLRRLPCDRDRLWKSPVPEFNNNSIFEDFEHFSGRVLENWKNACLVDATNNAQASGYSAA